MGAEVLRAGLIAAAVRRRQSNPKNLAFFVAILPQFIDPAGPVALQMAVLGGVSVLLELPVLLIYALAFSALAKVITERAASHPQSFHK